MAKSVVAQNAGSLIEAPRMLEGAGFEVRRPLPHGELQSVGPFIMLDHIGPATQGPGEAVGAPRHPHAGLETLSWFIEGGGEHRDSLGNHSLTGPGEAQWMRAGRGIVHDEGPLAEQLRDGGRAHMVQLWLDCPGPDRLGEPDYRHLLAADIPDLEAGEGVRVRLLAGRWADRQGPIAGDAQPVLLHIDLAPGARFDSPPQAEELAVYVLTGAIETQAPSGNVPDGHLLLGMPVAIRAGAEGAAVLLLGGAQLASAPFRHGPFVAADREEMVAIVERYQTGAFGDVVFD